VSKIENAKKEVRKVITIATGDIGIGLEGSDRGLLIVRFKGGNGESAPLGLASAVVVEVARDALANNKSESSEDVADLDKLVDELKVLEKRINKS